MGIDVQPGEIVTPVVLEGRIASPLGLVDHAPRPDQIAGLQLWLRADSLGLSDGDSVSTWRDESGQGNDATQGTAAAQPTFKTGVQNGKPVVRFDGTDDRLAVAEPEVLLSSDECHIFIVQLQGTDDQQATTFGWNAATSNRVTAHLAYSDDNLYWDFGNDTSSGRVSVAQPAGYENAFHIIELFRRTGGEQATIVDGSELVSAIRSATPDFSVDSDEFHIGDNEKKVDVLNGDIAELAIYDRSLSASEAQKVEDYLNAKYAIF